MLFKNRKFYILNFAVILALLGGMFGVVPARASAVIHVKWNASGANNGTSWANAYTDLQSALSITLSGDEIWVAAGTYKSTSSTDRTISFILKSGAAVYGGFTGTETSRAQRDFETHVTVLSGEIGIAGNNSDNSYHVVVTTGMNEPTHATILDGFTISDGNANGSINGSYVNRIGGGVYNNYGIPNLANLTFTNNSAVYGGGMYNEGSPTLTNITFNNNSAGAGGGIYNQDGIFTLTNVIFSNNSASAGGGIYNDHGYPTMQNVIFNENSASYGGGIYSKYWTSPSLTNVTFINNSANYDGGGMYNYTESNPILTNVTFSGNSADKGAGIYNYQGHPVLTDVTFNDNSATFGGGMYNYNYSDPILTGVIFSNNSATSGGGMYNDISGPSLTNVTFDSNSATDGGGMYNITFARIPLLENVTFVNNTATNGGGGMYNSNSNPTLTNLILSENFAEYGGGIYNESSSNPMLTNVTFNNNTAASAGGGMYNINSNPSLTTVTFNGNFSYDRSGGMYNSSSSPILIDVTFQGNGGSNGGGIYNENSSNPSLTNVTFNANSAGNGGGMFNVSSNAILMNVTFSNNSATVYGGGIFNQSSSPTLTNVTLSGNTSDDSGGGMFNYSSSSPSLINVTLSDNSATTGGGMYNWNSSPNISNSIFWGDNGSGGEITNFLSSTPVVIYNIVQGGYPGIGNLNANPLLGPLADNGGSTQTMALGADSPAIDAGDDTNCPSTDQRSILRPQGAACDMGSYEYEPTISVGVTIGGNNVGNYDVGSEQSVSDDYGINGGPVLVSSTDGTSPIFTSQRAIFGSSFNSIVGYPANQLTTDYWFTSYDDLGMITYLVIGNPDPTLTAQVDVYIGGIKRNAIPYSIAPGQRIFPRYGINAGPVHVVSTNGVDIFTSERTKFGQSFNEVMGIPGDQLTTDYWFTSYDDVGMITYLVIGNPDPTLTAEVDVYIGGVKKNTTPYSIVPGQRIFPRYAINGGPVHVVSTNGVDIFSSERTKFGQSFNEVLGYPGDQLSTEYWFTSYDDTSMITYLVIGNPDPTLTAEVDVYIAGVKKNLTPYVIAPGQRVFPRYAIDEGPVQVISTNGVDIFTSERSKYLSSFNEILGLPDNQLTTDYWFTSYDDLGMTTELIIAAP